MVTQNTDKTIGIVQKQKNCIAQKSNHPRNSFLLEIDKRVFFVRQPRNKVLSRSALPIQVRIVIKPFKLGL